MNKELFVSSTPHETKVGLVEDDLLAEIYLERENEYTLAGSIYKGRVTRVLPGMQSAFVDIGLERDAFLYVSDFMELEEHDDDLTDVVPANRARAGFATAAGRKTLPRIRSKPWRRRMSRKPTLSRNRTRMPSKSESRARLSLRHRPAVAQEPSGDSQSRERGSWRGRRRRRGGRRDGRERWPRSRVRIDVPERTSDRSSERVRTRFRTRSDRGRSRASHVLPRRSPRAQSIPAETSRRARRPATSQSCCQESRFPNTSAGRSSRPRSNRRLGGSDRCRSL